jgi:putative ABC transport system permease protein
MIPYHHSFLRGLTDVSPAEPRMSDHHPIPTSHLFFALLCPLSTALFAYFMRLEIQKKILIAVLRTVVQLFLAGYVLLGFIFSIQSPWLVLAYLVGMSIIASLEAISRQIRTYNGHYIDSLVSVLAGGGFFGIVCSILVFDPDPWWNPQVIVPTCGLLIGNSISGPSLAVDRFLSVAIEQKHEIETRLAFGASSYEAVIPTIRKCIAAGIMPTLNTMSVVGIVSIPGMMAGQLMGGASPIIAAEYQMAILWIICSTSTTAMFVALTLACYHAVVDSSHRMTTTKIIRKADGRVGIDVAVQSLTSNIMTTVTGKFSGIFLKQYGSNVYEQLDHQEDGEGAVDSGVQVIKKVARSESIDSTIFASCSSYTATISMVDGIAYSGDASAIALQANSINILTNGRRLFAEDGLTLKLRVAERVSIEGPSGLGKTRLLRAIAQLDTLTSGSLSIAAASQAVDLSSSDVEGAGQQQVASSSSAAVGVSWWNSLKQSICKGSLLNSFWSCCGDDSLPDYRSHCIYVPQVNRFTDATSTSFANSLDAFVGTSSDDWHAPSFHEGMLGISLAQLVEYISSII